MRVYNVRMTVAPAAEPVSLPEAKLHLRVDHTTEDDLINRLIRVARQHAELVSRWVFITRTYTAQVDRWPYGNLIVLPNPPLRSVDSIKYVDEDDIEHTFASGNYIVDTHSEPGRIVLRSGESWPSETLRVGGAIAIEYDAGFGNAAAVPDEYKQAMLLMIGHWYENREQVVLQPGVVTSQVPMAAKTLLMTDRAY